MSQQSNFVLMAEYNATMNQSLYAACSRLTKDELLEDRKAFFGSIINTLNHILIGDTIWLQRFADHVEDDKSLGYVRSLPKPSSLDAMLYADFSILKGKRFEMDEVILLFAKQLKDSDLSRVISYVSTTGVRFNKNFGHIVQHFFNHQTHHRGQVSTLLNQQGIDLGVTDLLINIPDVVVV
ncbi:DinB family protein [Marinomonas sp. C2222]|uniref:DinB family protein n=1 Tax=Marinomonas sargassi TaxID=2984494 RepID=A0ABT2YU42_9GAMM|nr:DinB family protein [Marinomonas sargassi]MCV2403295.1 DinB family protein [Marinomonas sargassi]